MNVNKIKQLVLQKTKKIDNVSKQSLHEFESVLTNSDIQNYLLNCLPSYVYQASGVNILTLEAIKDEAAASAAPGGYIFPYGYIIIATSFGGNGVCFHADSGNAYWVDHTSFSSDYISYKDKQTGSWDLIEFNEENVQRALVLLSTDIEQFLVELLTDQLTEQLDELD